MAVLAPKAPYGSAMGMGPTQPSVVSQYAVNFSNHKAPAASSQNAAFLSPTESEFSEPSDGQDSIRYAITLRICWEVSSRESSLRFIAVPGTKNALQNGCVLSTALNTSNSSKVESPLLFTFSSV